MCSARSVIAALADSPGISSLCLLERLVKRRMHHLPTQSHLLPWTHPPRDDPMFPAAVGMGMGIATALEGEVQESHVIFVHRAGQFVQHH